MLKVDQNIQMLEAKQFKYPYVVAYGRECISSRGDILVFLTLANAIAARDEMNTIENKYMGLMAKQWVIKRIPIDEITQSCTIFEDLINQNQVPIARDYSKSSLNWRSFGGGG